MLEMMRRYAAELGLWASTEQFETAIGRTREQLQNDSASVHLEEVRRSGSRLMIQARVENRTGHKFPTAFPSRRAWLRLVVREASGSVVFESGAYQPDGSIVGNDHDRDSAAFEPHYLAVVSPEQVQIYEAILADARGAPTTSLYAAAGFAKDNRLLPPGFDKGGPYPDLLPRGRAMEDEDFVGGEDQIQFVVDLGGASGPFEVTLELLYQSVGYRWVQDLAGLSGPEIGRFLRMAGEVPNVPVVVAQATADVE
jgi:hypothetical protein